MNYIKKLSQEKLQHLIAIKAGVCVCTCGECGDVMYYQILRAMNKDVICPHCKFKSEICDFPDLFSANWEK